MGTLNPFPAGSVHNSSASKGCAGLSHGCRPLPALVVAPRHRGSECLETENPIIRGEKPQRSRLPAWVQVALSPSEPPTPSLPILVELESNLCGRVTGGDAHTHPHTHSSPPPAYTVADTIESTLASSPWAEWAECEISEPCGCMKGLIGRTLTGTTIASPTPPTPPARPQMSVLRFLPLNSGL